MPNFAWEGRTRTGDLRKGVMEAPDADAVKAKLRAQQIQPEKVKRKAGDIQIQFGSGVSVKEPSFPTVQPITISVENSPV